MIPENSIDILEGSCSIQLSYGRSNGQNVKRKARNVEQKAEWHLTTLVMTINYPMECALKFAVYPEKSRN